MTIKTICMDCRDVIVDGPPSKDGLVSHGLCTKCYKKRKQELKVERR